MTEKQYKPAKTESIKAKKGKAPEGHIHKPKNDAEYRKAIKHQNAERLKLVKKGEKVADTIKRNKDNPKIQNNPAYKNKIEGLLKVIEDSKHKIYWETEVWLSGGPGDAVPDNVKKEFDKEHIIFDRESKALNDAIKNNLER